VDDNNLEILMQERGAFLLKKATKEWGSHVKQGNSFHLGGKVFSFRCKGGNWACGRKGRKLNETLGRISSNWKGELLGEAS